MLKIEQPQPLQLRFTPDVDQLSLNNCDFSSCPIQLLSSTLQLRIDLTPTLLRLEIHRLRPFASGPLGLQGSNGILKIVLLDPSLQAVELLKELLSLLFPGEESDPRLGLRFSRVRRRRDLRARSKQTRMRLRVGSPLSAIPPAEQVGVEIVLIPPGGGGI